MVKYSVKPTNVAKTSLARGDDLKVHFKNTFETARAIKGMKVARAETFLKNVLIKKEIVPFRVHNGGVGRKAQCKGKHCAFGRWPVKSAKYLLVLLKTHHTAVQQARSARRRLYRAHGRINSFSSHPCHVELILTEREEKVQKPKQGSKQHRKISTARKLTHLLL
ncbi:60S ribosomal protein L17 [Entamoeba marina]